MLNKMKVTEKGLFINRPEPFIPVSTFKKETIKTTFDFAYEMSFGASGEHRDHRSGGTHIRKKNEIFANTFQGKLSEFAIYNTLYKIFNLPKPDLSTYGLGEWDDYDFVIDDKKISIKSTKSFGNLLLLEKKDWNKSAEYIPNISKGKSVYDFFILVRIKPYCEDIFKDFKFSDFQNKENLKSKILSLTWEYDIPGFITKDDLKYAINNNYIIKQGEKLNGKVKMDADNYYIQAGDMKSLDLMKQFF